MMTADQIVPRHIGREQFARLTPEQQEAERLAEMYMERDVLACQSALVDDLLKGEADGFDTDDIENLYPDPSDWTIGDCREWLDDNGHLDAIERDPWEMDRAEIVEALEGEYGCACFDDETLDELREALAENDLGEDGWRDLVTDNAEAQEVYEWHLVTNWLADRLDEIGEPLIRNGYGNWWGRTCTGQSMMLDGTLQEIAKRYAAI